MLNDLFTDPAILKVLYNASDQLLWLQRDFGVFMVNLFDIQMALNLLDQKTTSFADVLLDKLNE